MATKKAVAKKATVAKVPKAPKKEKNVINVKAEVRFVSFKFGATIPTQSFGNVSPEIVVEAPSYEEARDFAIPKILELYNEFAEVKPTFLGKVTVTEKVVEAPAPAPKVEEAQAATPSSAAPSAPSSSESTAPAPVKSEAVGKAEKAISLAATKEALALIRTQIENSVKIDAVFKPDLLVLCDQKYAELDVF